MSHGRHGASLPAPPHTTISQHYGLLVYAVAPGVGHHGGCCRQFTSQRVDGHCGVVVGCVLRRNTSSSLASELSAWKPPYRMGCCAASTDLVHHGGMMRCSGGVKEGGIGAGGDYSSSMQTRALIDDGWSPSSYGRHRALLPAFEHTTINKHNMRQDYVIKTRKSYNY